MFHERMMGRALQSFNEARKLGGPEKAQVYLKKLETIIEVVFQNTMYLIEAQNILFYLINQHLNLYVYKIHFLLHCFHLLFRRTLSRWIA
jgi:uncharacterized membrane protein YukC